MSYLGPLIKDYTNDGTYESNAEIDARFDPITKAAQNEEYKKLNETLLQTGPRYVSKYESMYTKNLEFKIIDTLADTVAEINNTIEEVLSRAINYVGVIQTSAAAPEDATELNDGTQGTRYTLPGNFFKIQAALSTQTYYIKLNGVLYSVEDGDAVIVNSEGAFDTLPKDSNATISAGTNIVVTEPTGPGNYVVSLDPSIPNSITNVSGRVTAAETAIVSLQDKTKLSESYMLAVGPSLGTRNITISEDAGLTWKFPTSINGTTNPLFTAPEMIAYNGFMWVMCGNNLPTGNTTIQYSVDGINWYKTVGAFTTLTSSVIWANNRWIASGYPNISSSRIIYSLDGITWSPCTQSFFITGVHRAVSFAYNGTVIVGVTSSGTRQFPYSYDGVRWAFGNVPLNIFANATTAQIATNGSVFIAVSQFTIVSSLDGINWTNGGFTGITLTSLRAIVWNGIWILGGKSSDSVKVQYSLNGFAWNPCIITSGTLTDVTSIIFNGTQWVLSGVGVPDLYYSQDGITWSPSTGDNNSTNTTNGITNVSSRRTRYLANVSSRGAVDVVSQTNPSFVVGIRYVSGGATIANTVAISIDGGQSWSNSGITSPTSPICANPEDLKWNGSYFLLASDTLTGNTSIQFSPSGYTWYSSSNAFTTKTNALLWDSKRWIATGAGGSSILKYSYNGKQWFDLPNLESESEGHFIIKVQDTYFVVVGAKIYASEDLEIWTVILTVPGSINSIASDGFNVVVTTRGSDYPEYIILKTTMDDYTNFVEIPKTFLPSTATNFTIRYQGTKWFVCFFYISLYVSDDLIVWSEKQIFTGGDAVVDVIWNGCFYLALATISVWNSVSADSWSPVITPFGLELACARI